MLAILGQSIASKKFSRGKGCMSIWISAQHSDNLGMLSSGTVTSWGDGRIGQMWCRQSASVRWRCACFFDPPLCMRILCCAIVERKASGRLVLTRHSQVSICRCPHLFMPRKPNTLLLVLSDLGTRLFHQELCLFYCGERKAFFSHFCHIQSWAHVGLFKLYPTSWTCHGGIHVENLQGISWCV